MSPLNQELDTDLIRHFQEGNQQALEILVNRHKEKIFSSIFFMIKDKHIAEDIFQDVFFKVIDTLLSNRYQEEGKFLQWTLRVAHNLCVDHFRRIKNLNVINSGDNKEIFDNTNNHLLNADSKLEQSQTYDKMHAMLQHLPEEQREVIVMRHYADLSFKEIAKITNTSINTSLGRMRYGLINLRKMMIENQISL